MLIFILRFLLSTIQQLSKWWGKEPIKTRNGFVESISNVFYIPDLKANLLSIGQLQEKGYVITFQNDECEIYDSKRGSIAKMKMTTNRLYPLTLNIVAKSLMVKKEDTNWLWHFRYGHLHWKGWKTLSSKKMVTGLPDIYYITPPTEISESCVVAKHERNSFPSARKKRKSDFGVDSFRHMWSHLSSIKW